MAELLSRLFSAPVRGADVTVAVGDVGALRVLLSGEEARVERSAPKRRTEYQAGRHAARSALAALGQMEAALPGDGDGVPTFPVGVVGSISHTGRGPIYAAAVASVGHRALGLDVEETRTLGVDVISRVLTQKEREHLAAEAYLEDLALSAFSAKEAYYKCIYPRCRTFLEFHQVELRLSAPGVFIASVPGSGDFPELVVRTLRTEARVYAGAEWL